MTGLEELDEADIEEAIRRELDTLQDSDLRNLQSFSSAKYENTRTDLSNTETVGFLGRLDVGSWAEMLYILRAFWFVYFIYVFRSFCIAYIVCINVYLILYYIVYTLLFIENNSKLLIGQERWMKSSYPFGICPNLEL